MPKDLHGSCSQLLCQNKEASKAANTTVNNSDYVQTPFFLSFFFFKTVDLCKDRLGRSAVIE